MQFTATKAKIPVGSYATIEITGTITLDDFSFSAGFIPLVLSESNDFGYFQIKESIIGKNGTITFKSDYVTFHEDAVITINIPAK